MSHFTAEVPDVIVKPGKMVPMVGRWSPRAKAAMFLLGVALYAYLLLVAKTLYLRDQRLDRIAIMAADTDKMLHNLRGMEQSLAAELELADSLHDY